MRIAVCFSGQPRFIKEYADQIKTHLISRYDTDVYAHFWWDDTCIGKKQHHEHEDTVHNRDIVNEFIDTYNPVKMSLEPPPTIDLSQYALTCAVPDLSLPVEEIVGIFTRFNSQWASVKKTFALIDDPDKYDFIIRMRTDAKLLNPIDLSPLEKGLLYIQDGKSTGYDRTYGDYFAAGQTQTMREYMSLGDDIFEHWHKGVIHVHKFVEAAIYSRLSTSHVVPHEFGVRIDHSFYKHRKM
jgi:hypothetical protein